MSIRTAEDLSDTLAADLIWRKKELIALRFLAGRATQPDEKHALARSLVALLYAHWEGFVKQAATAYLEFVKFQRLTSNELAENFVALSVRTTLREAAATDQIARHIEVARFFRTSGGERVKIPVKGAIRTRSNLSSVVLKDILITIGLEFVEFETKGVLIDESLLNVRNTVAHGEYLKVDPAEFQAVYDEVVLMLDQVKTLIENAVALEAYRTREGR